MELDEQPVFLDVKEVETLIHYLIMMPAASGTRVLILLMNRWGKEGKGYGKKSVYIFVGFIKDLPIEIYKYQL